MLFAIVAILILIADQWLKYWVTVNITLSTGSHELIPGVVKLVNIHNSGAAFGLLDNVSYARWIFLAITAVFVIVIVLLLVKRVFDSPFAVWCEVLFLTGALGNCIDRVFLGYVVDMFKLDFVNFAVFNIADAVLVVSCLMFVIYVFFGSRSYDDEAEKKPARKKAKTSEPEPAAEPADDFADIFGISTAAKEQSEASERITAEPEKTRSAADSFWDDFGPATRSNPAPMSVKPRPKAKAEPAASPVKAKPAQDDFLAGIGLDEFDVDSIIAEFKDL